MDVVVETNPPSRIQISPGGLANWLKCKLEERAHGQTQRGLGVDFVVIDARVLELHGDLLQAALRLPHFVVNSGERSKSMANLGELLSALSEAGLNRTSRLLSVGGGVTSDLAGLAAALYMRGIDWISVPTTLLAQVDASVGGKTAVNLSSGKNLVGAFHQPSEVLVDTVFLETLEQAEWRSGLGEVLKAALLGAKTPSGQLLYDCLERATDKQLTRQSGSLIAEIITACITYKASVVSEDFRESGPRKQLNLGHTFAHAIEHVLGFGKISHGVAVAVGLGMALEQSAEQGVLKNAQLPARTAALATRLKLPTGLDALETELAIKINQSALKGAMQLDKKASLQHIQWVLIEDISNWTLSPATPRTPNEEPTQA